ncbi:Medium-chain-fatty-acid--CoA ligase [Chlorella vulgaris]
MRGLMQDAPLVTTAILDYAAKWHGETEVLSVTAEGVLETSNWQNVACRSKLCARALKKLSIRPGDRVATLAFNNVRHLECWYGCGGIGAITHTLNPRLFEDDLAYIINHAQDKVILADTTFVRLLEALQPRIRACVKHIVFLTDRRHMPKHTELQGALCYEELLEQESAGLEGFKWEVRDECQACGLCYTSGTTGPPKGVLYSHRSNFLHAFVIAMPDTLDLRGGSTILMVVPMFHANSWGLVFAAPMVGARLVLPGPFLDGASMHRLMEEQGVTHTAGVPTVWLGLQAHMEQHQLQLSSLKMLAVGGAACPRRIIEFFDGHGVEVRQLWGMTELSPAGTIGAVKASMGRLEGEALVQLKLKQGRPHALLDMRIVRGPTTLSQYFKSDSPATDEEGWFDTGDITDRSKDVIKSGGEWISSLEVENAAVGHAGVAEAAVIAIPHDKWGERPLLVVVAKEGQKPTRDDILSYLDGKIAKWWIPDDVVFVKEIPHTATGKISKLSLRRSFASHKPHRSRM